MFKAKLFSLANTPNTDLKYNTVARVVELVNSSTPCNTKNFYMGWTSTENKKKSAKQVLTDQTNLNTLTESSIV